MKLRKTVMCSCLCVLAGVGFVAAEFEISRSTIDDGGITARDFATLQVRFGQ